MNIAATLPPSLNDIRLDWDDLPPAQIGRRMERWGKRKVWYQKGLRYERSEGVPVFVTRDTHMRFTRRLFTISQLRLVSAQRWHEIFTAGEADAPFKAGELRRLINTELMARGLEYGKGAWTCFDAPLNSFNQVCSRAFKERDMARYPWNYLSLTQPDNAPRATPFRLICGLTPKFFPFARPDGWWQVEAEMGPAQRGVLVYPATAVDPDLAAHIGQCTYAECALEEDHWSVRFVTATPKA